MNLRRFALTLAASAAVCALLAPGALAAPKPKKGGKPDAAAAAAAAGAADKPYGDWKKLTKDAEVIKGWFTLYRKRENLYMEIRPDQLDKEFLGIFSFARGIGSNFVLGGLPLNDRLLEFRRSGDRILVMEKNPRFTAPAGTPMAKAVDLSIPSSVIASLKVESVHDSTRAVLVDFANFVVSDVSDLAEGLRQATTKSMRFDKERSAVTSVKAFPENVEIQALLTYSPNDRQGLSLGGVPDERFVPITVHYSFSKLPESPMQPRLADERVGYFLTAIKDFSRGANENFWVRYVNRWRLEKKDPTAAVSEVKKPITFYIDHTVPQEYRRAVREGVEKWQKAFEAAGLKNAIVCLDAPNDSNYAAEDVRYSTLRWITSHEPSFGAIGPSRVDPRTGEILDADILFEESMFQNYRNAYRRWSGPDAIAQSILPELRAQQAPPWISLERRCEAQAGAAEGIALLHSTLAVDGAMPPGSPVPDEYLHDAIVWVVMHEVGHTLGLRHNFRSSTSTPYDKLNDRAWVDERGMYSSVMEYPTPNVSLDRARQGYYYTRGAGTEDVWRIRYAYEPSGETDLEKDHAYAARIADQNTAPGHEYSTDDDTYPAVALDPRSNIYDLGDDPLRFARDRTTLIRGLWSNPKYEERVLGPNGEYPVLRRAVDNLIQQYGIALGHAVKYVGGSYQTRVRRGQPGAVEPLVPVPAARQREAVDFLAERAFAADAFTLSATLQNRLAADRWSHWGMPGSWGPNPDRFDYNLNGRALAIQTTLLNAMTAPALLARVKEQQGRMAEPFTLADYFDRLTRSLWARSAAARARPTRSARWPAPTRAATCSAPTWTAWRPWSWPRRPAFPTTRAPWRGSSCSALTRAARACWPRRRPSPTWCVRTCSRRAPASSARSRPGARRTRRGPPDRRACSERRRRRPAEPPRGGRAGAIRRGVTRDGAAPAGPPRRRSGAAARSEAQADEVRARSARRRLDRGRRVNAQLPGVQLEQRRRLRAACGKRHAGDEADHRAADEAPAQDLARVIALGGPRDGAAHHEAGETAVQNRARDLDHRVLVALAPHRDVGPAGRGQGGRGHGRDQNGDDDALHGTPPRVARARRGAPPEARAGRAGNRPRPQA